MAYKLYTLLPGSSIKLWIQVVATLLCRLFALNLQRSGLCQGILPDPCHLPGNFHHRCPPRDFKTIIGDLLRYIEIWPRSTDRGKLVAEIAIECSKPRGKLDHGLTIGI